VGDCQAARSGLNGDLDAVSVMVRADREVGLQIESRLVLSQQGANPTRRKGERLNRIPSDRFRERIRDGTAGADTRQSLDGVQQVALASRVRAEQYRESRKRDAHFVQRLEPPNTQLPQHEKAPQTESPPGSPGGPFSYLNWEADGRARTDDLRFTK